MFLEAAAVVGSGQLGAPIKVDLVADMPMNTVSRCGAGAVSMQVV